MNEYLNKITRGDSYQLIKRLPDKSVDCIYVDVPYLYLAGGTGTSKIAKGIQATYKELTDTNITDGFDFAIFNDFVRVMKNINCFVWCSRLQIRPILDWFAKNTDCTYNILTWNKTNPIPICNGNWLSDIEYCLYFNRQSKLNDGMELKSKWYTSAINQKDKALFEHPTIKPLPLVKRHLLHTTQPNDIVLDCFMGSGTTAVACKDIGRQFIGFEIDQKWVNIANERLNGTDKSGQTCMFLR